MPNRWNEREGAIVRGIISLIVNECDALECLKKQGSQALYEVVAQKVRPTLHVCADEFAQVTRDLAEVRQKEGALRLAVETVIANQHTAPAENAIVMTTLRDAAPGHTFL